MADDLPGNAGGAWLEPSDAPGSLGTTGAVFVDAQDADVTRVMVAAGVDATRNMQVDLTDVVASSRSW